LIAEAVLTLVVWLAPVSHEARTWELESVGVYTGFSYSAPAHYKHSELVASIDTPWDWSSPKGWRVAAQAHVIAGALWAAGDTSTIVGGGPQVRIDHSGKQLILTAGTGPLWTTGNLFREENDLGGPVQFLSHLSIGIALGEHRQFRLLGRIAHISNAGIYSRNPGADTYGLVLEYGVRGRD